MPQSGPGIRGHFVLALSRGLRVVWPILSSILACQLAFGFLIAWLEDWSLGDGVYFSFVTGLTIGYQPVEKSRFQPNGSGVLLTAKAAG